MRPNLHAILVIALAGFFPMHAGDDQAVPYPEGYRHWTHLHSSLISATLPGFWKRPCEKPCTAGIFHFFGNDKAMTGLRTGEYADGAIIAEELLEVLGSASGGGKEGERRTVGVMVKDSKRYESTGGWGFGSFDGATKENQLDSAARKACFECHIPRKDHGYVFTEYRER
jgi:Cytochrome P460